MNSEIPKKQFTFGTCNYHHTSPNLGELAPETRTMNIFITFEEALKLDLAIDECVRELNSYKRSTKKGRRTALNLTIYLENGRIAVNEGSIKE